MKENTAPNAQITKMEDLTDDQLLNEKPSNDPQQLQNDLAYWQTRVSFFFNLTVHISEPRHANGVGQAEGIKETEEARSTRYP